MNGKEVRRLITEIEQYGIYILSHMIYQGKNILCDQEWLEKMLNRFLNGTIRGILLKRLFLI